MRPETAYCSSTVLRFQFTHPVWGATSITHISLTSTFSFNSRTPCGVRLTSNKETTNKRQFQFTHPVWGATGIGQLHLTLPNVSIHAPRVGCDQRPSSKLYNVIKFQFTHPVWGATLQDCQRPTNECRFNSRTPCGVRLPRSVG